MVSSTTFCNYSSDFPRPSSSTTVLSGSVIILSAGAGVFGVVASLMLPFPGGGGRVGERSLELTLPERLKGPAGEETPFFRKGLSVKLMKEILRGIPLANTQRGT